MQSEGRPFEDPHPDDQERRLLEEGIIGREGLDANADSQARGCLGEVLAFGLIFDVPGCFYVIFFPIVVLIVLTVVIASSLEAYVLVPVILLLIGAVLLVKSKRSNSRSP